MCLRIAVTVSEHPVLFSKTLMFVPAPLSDAWTVGFKYIYK